MKRNSDLMVFVFAVLLMLPQFVHAATVRINDSGLVDADMESPLSFDIRIEGAEDLGSFQFDLYYDPSLVTIQSVALGAFPESSGRIFQELTRSEEEPGKITYGAFSMGDSEGPGGDGTLATVTFALNEAGFADQGSAVLDFDDDRSWITNTKGGSPQPAKWLDGKIARLSKITAVAGNGGTIEPSGERLVERGMTQSFDLIPDICHNIADISVDGVSAEISDPYLLTGLESEHVLAVSFSPKTPYTVTAEAGEGGGISPSGDLPTDCGTDRTFSVTPDSCHHIADLMLDGVSLGPLSEYALTDILSDHSISATFSPNDHRITATAGDCGKIEPSGVVSLPCGTQKFAITADSGCYVEDVVVDGLSQGALDAFIFSDIVKSHTIHAVFGQTPPECEVETLTDGRGMIAPSYSRMLCGKESRTRITPSDCHEIMDVELNGVSVSDDVLTDENGIGTYAFVVDGDSKLEASFRKKTYTVSVASSEGGSLSFEETEGAELLDHGAKVECGTSVAVMVTPDGCHTLKDVLDDESSMGSEASFLLADVKENHTLRPEFEKNRYEIQATWEGCGGTVLPEGETAENGKTQVLCGEDVPYVITPDAEAGCRIFEVRVNGKSHEDAKDSGGYVFENVISHDNKIHVVFDPHVITASAGEHGSIEPSGDVRVAHGDEREFSVTPDKFHEIDDVRIDERLSVMDQILPKEGGGGTYTFENVDRSFAIEATFRCAEDSAGDVNADESVGLVDAILSLQVASGKGDGESLLLCADVNGDGAVGLEEAIFVLQLIAGLRD